MTIIDGKKTAADLRSNLKNEVDNLKKKFNRVPGLTVILIGEYAPSKIYVRNKEKSALEIGLKSEIIKYPNTVDEKTVLEKISELNKDQNVSGILVQLPLPKHITENDDYDKKVGLAVRVDKFSDSSIDMYVRCFTKTNSWNEWLKVKEKLAIEIKQIVEKNKASFAFPSQSIYVEKK